MCLSYLRQLLLLFFFFFNDTATTEIYTLSLHDALPISGLLQNQSAWNLWLIHRSRIKHCARSEEHTSELQSQSNLVCRLLLEKKKKNIAAIACASAIRISHYHVHKHLKFALLGPQPRSL